MNEEKKQEQISEKNREESLSVYLSRSNDSNIDFCAHFSMDFSFLLVFVEFKCVAMENALEISILKRVPNRITSMYMGKCYRYLNF